MGLKSVILICALAFGAEFSFATANAPAGDSLFSSGTFETTEPQKMTIINEGFQALEVRLQLIEQAKTSIDVDYFIYKIDEASRLFSQALLRKAHEGVKVRILVDGWPEAHLNAFYASAFRRAGIEVRYYNPEFFMHFQKVEFRSHRKALIVDNRIFVTGGRNIADEYYDMKPTYNFLDRDIMIEGSLADIARRSFEKFWNSGITKPAPLIGRPERHEYGLNEDPQCGLPNDRKECARFNQALQYYDYNQGKVEDYFRENDEDRRYLQRLKVGGEKPLKARTCNDSIYVADLPGTHRRDHKLYQLLQTELLQAKNSIEVESPYFIMSPRSSAPLLTLLARGVKIEVLTNSLYSVDTVYTVSAFYSHLGSLIEKGMDVSVYRGVEIEAEFLRSEERPDHERWGLHAKSVVIDHRTTMVGTFNADPRSRNINAEMAVLCRGNPDLAQDVLASMSERLEQASRLDAHGSPVSGQLPVPAVSLPKEILYLLLTPLSNIFDYLL